MTAATQDALVNRDPREYLSKSFMGTVEFCGWEAWHALHHPRPFLVTEKVAFGRAVDAGVMILIDAARAGMVPELDRALAAAAESVLEADIEVDFGGIAHAIEAWLGQVHPEHDWAYSATQHHIRLELPGIGAVDAHPDIILRDQSIFDLKTSSRAKPADAARTAYRELGFYALLREAEKGQRPPRVGYITWVRSQRPYWQTLETPVTDEMLRKAWLNAATVARAIAADDLLNDGAEAPANYTFLNGPAWAGKCATCTYSPANGGPCEMAEEGADAA